MIYGEFGSNLKIMDVEMVIKVFYVLLPFYFVLHLMH